MRAIPIDVPGAAWRRLRLGRVDILASVLLGLLAIAARLPFIVRGETMLHNDEAIVGLMAQDIAEGNRFPLYFYGQRYMGALEAYVIAALRFIFEDPLISLRVGPLCFFVALVVLQYLMLTRWFGRLGGLTGGLALVCAAPMFVQWSISARGGYIEIMVWGTMLWWAYSEWFTESSFVTTRPWHQAVLGFLLGSGMWINPAIAVFVAPIVVHWLMANTLRRARQDGLSALLFRRLDVISRRVPLSLPALALLVVLGINCLFAVHVTDSGVEHLVLLNVLPEALSVFVLVALILAGAVATVRHVGLETLRATVRSAGGLILGVTAGSIPAFIYFFGAIATGRPLDDGVPLGLRPIWTIGETLNYLWHGLPLLITADVRPFLDLVLVGRAYQTNPLPEVIGAIMTGLHVLTLILVLAGIALAILNCRSALGRAFGLQPGCYPPEVLLILALCSALALYVLAGCSFDFTTIRYVVPLWAVLPGVLASLVAAERLRYAGRFCVSLLLLAWTTGQVSYFARLGPPHPLAGVSRALKGRGLDLAVAETLDAHVLSFLTQQQPRVAEYDPFWSRLSHYRSYINEKSPVHYVVHASDTDWTQAWIRAGWPGDPPIETERFLWPALKQLQAERPKEILAREPLVDGFELWTLKHRLPEGDGKQ